MPMNKIKEQHMQPEYSHLEEAVADQSKVFAEINANLKELWNLGAYATSDDYTTKARIISEIVDNNKEVKEHPLFLFMPSIDMSMSVLRGTKGAERIEVLEKVISIYMKNRYVTYNDESSLSILSQITKMWKDMK